MQVEPYLVSYWLGYTYRIAVEVMAGDVDGAQKSVAEAIQQDTLHDDHEGHLKFVAENFAQTLSRFVVKSVDESNTSVTVFDVSPPPALAMTHVALHASTRHLLAAAQSVLDRWEHGDLAEAVRHLGLAVESCSRTR